MHLPVSCYRFGPQRPSNMTEESSQTKDPANGLEFISLFEYFRCRAEKTMHQSEDYIEQQSPHRRHWQSPLFASSCCCCLNHNQGHGVTGASPGVFEREAHPGQVASPLQGNTETHRINNLVHTHSYLKAIKTDQLT
ncbi:hypothetical protein CHARACLAT_009580 [Characodon lateralis]|uniref:Uncharacterized protein n=1 Tax=Characodon lateralis TaxID=208331 RepID=A0ABU7F1Z5_9TELE|nr:hypothetical protein [Characodon lateralis]